MIDLTILDLILLGPVILLMLYFTHSKLWDPKKKYSVTSTTSNGATFNRTRDIVAKLEESGKDCVIFYGSQTGTAENFATRLANEGRSRFGLQSLVADLDSYDYDNLDAIPSDKVVIFILATYGEGEPTDNAVEFFDFLVDESVTFSEDNAPPLGNLNFTAFGLGNHTYQHYNAMVRRVSKTLLNLGANPFFEHGEGDDGAGTMEEDFLAWKDPMWAALARKLCLQERETVYEPTFSVVESQDLTIHYPEVYLGEPNQQHLGNSSTPTSPFNAHNPYLAPVVASRDLFMTKERDCIHMELDLAGSGLSYQTGDHVAIWPSNLTEEVERFLHIFGLSQKQHQVITITGLDSVTKVPFPSPTTYHAIACHYLEICQPVSRQLISSIAGFSSNETIKAEMLRLGSDKEYFHQRTKDRFFNIARLLSDISQGEPWTEVPFSIIIESIMRLQPRYYSISSSSLVQPQKVSITAVVESRDGIPGRVKSDSFKGVATNYLLAVKQQQNDDHHAGSDQQSYKIFGPRDKYSGLRIPIHIRHSNFKLPVAPGTPIIMVGPGTGVAPFRAFVQERAKQAQDGIEVGRTLLFFGCRKPTEDFIYSAEWAVSRPIAS